MTENKLLHQLERRTVSDPVPQHCRLQQFMLKQYLASELTERNQYSCKWNTAAQMQWILCDGVLPLASGGHPILMQGARFLTQRVNATSQRRKLFVRPVA